MSDYDSFESGAESELGSFEEALEISGYDAVTTTQEGMRQDEFLKESGMAIDTVGDAKKVEEKREKREKNSESGIAAAFEAARHHVDNHKYEMKFDGKDYEISHGDLKKFMRKEQEHLAKQAKAEKDPKKKAQMQKDAIMMQQLLNHMNQSGELTEDQQKQFEDYIERNPDARTRLTRQLEVNSVNADDTIINRLNAAIAKEEIKPDIRNDDNSVCLSPTFDQNSLDIVICDVPTNEIDITNTTIRMTNDNNEHAEGDKLETADIQLQQKEINQVTMAMDF